MFKRSSIFFLVFTLLISGNVLFLSAETEAARGSHLVVIGGSLGSGDAADDIYETMIDLSGGEDGKIGIITASSYPYDWDCEDFGESTDGGCNDPDISNSKMNANYYIDAFDSFGIEAEWVPVDIANIDVADDQEWADRISSGEFSGFFLGGGDQSRYITSLVREDDQGNWSDSAVLSAMRDRFEEGKLMIAGSSAGAAAQSSEYMITGGDSYRGVTEGAIEGYHTDGSVLGYYENGGLGFFSYGLVDSHFSERAREGRMIRLASDVNVDKVYGVDETTALVVKNANHPSAEMEVVGENGVQIFDLSSSTSQNNQIEGEWEIDQVKSTYLHDGDRYKPNQGNVIFNSQSNPYRGQGSSDHTHDDIFYETNAYKNLTRDLVTSDAEHITGTSFEDSPRYELTATQTKQTQVRMKSHYGQEQWSYDGVMVKINPE
ncbi:cyanophycinase [Salipaludibacillus daqingensis]|uniref:cyanophycinase n=1 Tax=Salipaludibacillus daqingensis TaxID=3041001 RepID=UPI0024762468|nr:cyanophycinase [Salipaludibacillus daqingensis]